MCTQRVPVVYAAEPGRVGGGVDTGPICGSTADRVDSGKLDTGEASGRVDRGWTRLRFADPPRIDPPPDPGRSTLGGAVLRSSYSVKATAAALDVDPRTVRRWIATGQAPGAYQDQTPTGPTWRLPLDTVEALRTKVAKVAEPVLPFVELAHPEASPPPAPLVSAAGASETAALAVVRLALDSQASTIAAQQAQVEAAREDALWWRCEALDLRQQLDAARAELASANLELAELRATVDRHHRPTVRLADLQLVRHR